MAEKKVAPPDASSPEGDTVGAVSVAGLSDVVNSLGRVTQALADTVSRLEQVASVMTPPQQGVPGGAGVVPPGATQVNTWEDDPFSEANPTVNPPVAQPVAVPTPAPTLAPLSFRISGQQPPAGLYASNTANFRYWGAFEALARGIRFWMPLLPPSARWSTLSSVLEVVLDDGEDLNAFYSRNLGLRFFHGRVPGHNLTVFSVDSPNVVHHELGHALLDALKPQLFNTASIEAGAFHESFGDMSSILCALELPSLRAKVLAETQGRLNTNSRLSRLAEQLGWAIRQIAPTAVERDSLRNAANNFRYRDPISPSVPSTGPASLITREPHSFSRIFTGAFLDALAGMTVTLGGATDANLQTASRTLGRLLVDGVRGASVVPAFFSQVAAAMIQSDRARSGGRFVNALNFAFINHGILSPGAPVTLMTQEPPPALVPGGAADALSGGLGVVGGGSDLLSFPGRVEDEGYRLAGGQTPEQPIVIITGPGNFNVQVHAPYDDTTALFASVFTATVAATGDGPTSRAGTEAAQLFMETLIQLGQVDIPPTAGPMAMLNAPKSREKSHELVPGTDGTLILKRLHFDCGFCSYRH